MESSGSSWYLGALAHRCELYSQSVADVLSEMLRSPVRADAESEDSADKNKNKINMMSKCSACNVIIIELLAFVSDNVDTLPKASLIQICRSLK